VTYYVAAILAALLAGLSCSGLLEVIGGWRAVAALRPAFPASLFVLAISGNYRYTTLKKLHYHRGAGFEVYNRYFLFKFHSGLLTLSE